MAYKCPEPLGNKGLSGTIHHLCEIWQVNYVQQGLCGNYECL